jgi:cell division protein FtsB
MRLVVITLIVLLALLHYRLWVGEGSVAEVWTLRQAVKAQRTANQQLRERNRVLEAEVKDLKGGLQAIEERARTELGMIREGETFYQIVEPHARSPAPE